MLLYIIMNNKFKYRSKQDELIDAVNVSPQVLIQNLKELDLLNRLTGGHAMSLEGVRCLITEKNKVYNIMDLGCGSGDWLLFMAKWAKRSEHRLKLIGIDKSETAIQYLNDQCRNYPEIIGVTGDYMQIMKSGPVDIFHCGLFCHHLSDSQLTNLFNYIGTNARTGFVINDLRRSALAYYAAKFSTHILRGSYLSKHDGPVSVLRGFKRAELCYLLKEAGISDFKIYKRFFFRFLVVGLPTVNMNLIDL